MKLFSSIILISLFFKHVSTFTFVHRGPRLTAAKPGRLLAPVRTSTQASFTLLTKTQFLLKGSRDDEINQELKSKAKNLGLGRVDPVEDDEEGTPPKVSDAASKAARKAEFEKTINKMGAMTSQDRGREVFEYTSKEPSTPLTTSSSPSTSVKVPLLGTLDIDGSLLLVVPVAVIGILGVLTSFYIGLTSTDNISAAMQQMREEESYAKSSKKSENTCRGLCSDQDSALQEKRQRMESKSGTEKALSIFF
ncbi:hypothetical protein TrLO_g1286 [Triparma laevis f. longispina]|uniref:Transmembrane protein n=1 Tax=Triparma laevis f. longispina TaxID=1714387 RepID=A0A9W7KRY7_9STRA|nr:hypothetical protein TrLO_g1286 [Triparma laevis f. longispina]